MHGIALQRERERGGKKNNGEPHIHTYHRTNLDCLPPSFPALLSHALGTTSIRIAFVGQEYYSHIEKNKSQTRARWQTKKLKMI